MKKGSSIVNEMKQGEPEIQLRQERMEDWNIKIKLKWWVQWTKKCRILQRDNQNKIEVVGPME